MDQIADHVAPKTAFQIFGINVSESVVWGAFTVLLLIIFAAVVRIFVIPKFKIVPGKFQIIVEWLMGCFDSMSIQTGRFSKYIGPYIFGTAAFICVGTLLELTGLRPPIADINTCAALALMSFFLINLFGIRKHGPIGRIKYYFKPSAIVGPFRIMSDLMVPVSMSFRLFGSILSGMITMEIIYAALEELIVVPLVFPAFFSIIFTLFHAFIQAYIFAVLTTTFVAEATE